MSHTAVKILTPESALLPTRPVLRLASAFPRSEVGAPRVHPVRWTRCQYSDTLGVHWARRRTPDIGVSPALAVISKRHWPITVSGMRIAFSVAAGKFPAIRILSQQASA
jgi:hypothetical protein